MPVRVVCPSCATVSNLPDSVRGKSVKVTCKVCGDTFPFKGPSTPAKPAPAAPQPAQVKPKPAPARPKPVQVKEQPAYVAPLPAPPQNNLAFNDDSTPLRRTARARGRGTGWLLLILLLIGAGGAAAVYFFVFDKKEGNNQVAQTTDKGPDRKGDPKGKQPVIPPTGGKTINPLDFINPPEDPVTTVVPPPRDPMTPTDPMPPKNPMTPIVQPPPKDPVPPRDPVTPPPMENATRTPDGAMTLTAHPQKHLRFSAISPDGKTIYTAAGDNMLRIWDAEKYTLKEERPLPKPDKQQNTRLQATLSPDGKSLFFAHWDVLQVMDLQTGKIEVFEGMPMEQHSLSLIQLSADGKTVLTNWATVDYALWNVPDRKFVSKFKYDGMGLARSSNAALSADGKHLFQAPYQGNSVHVRSLPDGGDMGNFSGPEKLEPIEAINYNNGLPVLSPNGTLLAFSQSRKGVPGVRVFNTSSRAMVHDLPLNKFGPDSSLSPMITAIAISPDDKLLVVLDTRRWLHGYDLEKGEFLGAFAFPKGLTYGGDDRHVVAFTSDGKKLMAGAANFVKVWDRDAIAWTRPPVEPPK